MNDQKLTVTGAVDPITVVAKLRKSRHAEVLSVGPAKEEKKKEEPKKEGDKEKEKGKDTEKDQLIAELIKANYQTYYNPYIYYAQSAEENPNACVVM